MTDEEMKQWIDSHDYMALLCHWRFAKVGDPFFQGEIGEYYQKVMFAKRDAIGHDAAVAASKAVGWER